jgi:hypothetical protein
MSIQTVHIKKFLVLDNFEAELKGKNIMLLADNEKGKSSFLRFIQIALGRTDLIPTDATVDGMVVADKGGKQYTFRVETTKTGKVKVSVEGADGMVDERKGVIANIVGALKFNIDDFVKLSESKAGQKEQVKIFKSFLPKDVQDDLARFEAHIDSLYNQRTDINKDKVSAEKLIQNHEFKHVPDLSIYKQVDVLGLTKQKEEIKAKLNGEYLNAKKVNEEIRQAHKVKCDKLREEITKHNEGVQVHRGKHTKASEILLELRKLGYEGVEVSKFVLDLQGNIKELKNFTEPELTGLLNEMPDDAPIKAIDEQLLKATETNSNYISAQQLIKFRQQYKELEDLSGELTVKIDSERQAISDTIKQMDSPVEGLEYDNDLLRYNGIEVSMNTMSTSAIIELGVKLKMAENKELGILLIEHGESLGKERLAYILDIAKNNGFQVIMEQVVRGKDKLTIEIIGE